MANTGGQTLNDRLNAARYALAGQGLARVVCKATTEELLAPKKKHLDYLLQCTYEANVSIPQMANLLIERTTHNSWIVVFKALITVHHLMCYGNERFTQYLASSNSSFQLSNYLDKSSSKGYDISTYIRRYAKYLNEKALSYRSVALDFAKMKRGKEEGSLRTMTNDKLLKILPILQNQVDALLEFDCTPLDLSNGVINAAFLLLFKDLVRLFACYNDGIINLLEKFFEMQRKQCREALDIYKKFLIRMDKVAEFLKVAETVGVDKIDIPDLTKAPASLLDALEHHVVALEAKGKRYKEKRERENQEHKLSTSTTSNIENDQVKKALEEEAALMNQLKNDLFELEEPGFKENLFMKTNLNAMDILNNNVDLNIFNNQFNNQLNRVDLNLVKNLSNDLNTYYKNDEFNWKNELDLAFSMEKHVKDKPFNPFINSEKNNDLTSFDVSNKQIATKNSSNNIIDLFGPNGTNNQTRNILNNSNPNNLPFNSNKTDTNEKLNSQTLNKDQTVLNISSFNKPNNSDLLVLTNNSNAFHNNIFSQNHNITSFYNQFPSFSYNSNTNRYSLVSSFNLVSNPLAKNITLNQNTNINSMPQLSLNQNLQIITNNHHTLKNTFNNRNNLLMQPAFTTANMNPFTSGFASHSTTQSEHQCGSNSRNFEPNFANAFGTSSSSNGLIKKLPPSRPPPPSNKKKAFDAFGDILQPQKTSITTPQSTSNDNSLLSLMNNNNTNNNNKSSIILKGDLDTTLANLAENLDLKSKRMNAKY